MSRTTLGTPQEFMTQLGFPPDEFQVEAMESIAQGHSVVVCAPTGSGKTLIAEYATYQSLHVGRRIFYTTPLKALSNQKFYDFKRQYGDDQVGLLTGDISINRDARILVMTTEIFRNMLYGIQVDPKFLENVGYVVLDECHYMNDAERGTVWEESIIYCPHHIQLIALSATVANAQELTDWINQVHHDTRLIQSDFRPVPLRFSFYDRGRLTPLFDTPGKMNKSLKTHVKGNRFAKHQRAFKPNELVTLLDERDMLPAIFFTFSRKDCDMYLRDTRDLQLLKPDERTRIKKFIADFVAQNPYLANNPQLSLIANGFASHHAGLLPGIKHLVENLFQQGLIKAVFATETLAAGINMPARSTVITKISKRGDEGHRLLHANEFLQMSGRAGRRGMDKVGYVVVVSSQYEGAREAATLASASSDPLNSQFTPTYGMVLNLLQRHTLERSEFLIRQSFGQFTSVRRLLPLQEDIVDKTDELKEYLNFKCPYEVSDQEFHSFLKSGEKLNEAHHVVRVFKKQVKQHGPHPDIIKQLSQAEGKRNNLQSMLDKSACKRCPIIDKHEKIEGRVLRLQKQLKQLNKYYDQEKDIYWQNFLSIYGLLKEGGYLDDNDIPTEKGKVTSQLRTENEYYVSEAIFQGILDGLRPDQLAGVMCAVVNDSNKEHLFSKLDYSHEVHATLLELGKLQRKVRHLQQIYGVETNPNLNPVASGLVQSWAQGVTWDRLVQSTNMGEGDIVRIIRRTADILRQIYRLEVGQPVEGSEPLVPTALMKTAKEALALIDRAPVKEVEIVEVAPVVAAQKTDETNTPDKTTL